MAAGVDGSWLAVAPVSKMKLVGFLIYDFQTDGVCGLSPTLVLIRKEQDYSDIVSGNLKLITRNSCRQPQKEQFNSFLGF